MPTAANKAPGRNVDMRTLFLLTWKRMNLFAFIVQQSPFADSRIGKGLLTLLDNQGYG